MAFHSVNTDMIITWNYVHLFYKYEENVIFPDNATKFGGGLQWSMSQLYEFHTVYQFGEAVISGCKNIWVAKLRFNLVEE